MKLKNYDELIPQIARMILEHDKARTGYQEDIYLYVNQDGTGTLKLFQNVGGNSWLNDDHYTVCRLPERRTDWTDTFQNLCSIAGALNWSVATLINRVAAWASETNGVFYMAADVKFSDVQEFIENHQPLLDRMYEAEAQVFEDAFSEYVDEATEIMDNLLMEVE